MFDINEFSNRLFKRERLKGQQVDERIIHLARKHPLFLLIALVFPFLLLILSLFLIPLLGVQLLLGAASFAGWTRVLLILVLCLVPISLIWLALAYVEWENDQLILTNRRVILLRKMFRLFEDRQEVDLRKIQDIGIVVPGPLAQWLGYGDLVVATASVTSRIGFARIARVHQVKEAIFQQRQQLVEREQQDRGGEIRETLERQLGLGSVKS